MFAVNKIKDLFRVYESFQPSESAFQPAMLSLKQMTGNGGQQTIKSFHQALERRAICFNRNEYHLFLSLYEICLLLITVHQR